MKPVSLAPSMPSLIRQLSQSLMREDLSLSEKLSAYRTFREAIRGLEMTPEEMIWAQQVEELLFLADSFQHYGEPLGLAEPIAPIPDVPYPEAIRGILYPSPAWPDLG